MTKRERVEAAYAFLPVDRVPFVPAVYEHKARLAGRTPSEVCRNAGLLRECLERELETYDPDMLVVGLDVYNVEAEALGCVVRYFPDSADVPAVQAPLIDGPAAIRDLGLPDPGRDGRMPLLVETAAGLHRDIGRDVIVRGALTGPFSLAAALAGTETLLMATVDGPASVRKLLEFAARVTVVFGRAFLEKGVETIVFDSKASPGASSPRVFREFVMPVYRDVVVPGLRSAGARWTPLIIGGDTTPVLEDLLSTGASQLLCDAGADLALFRKRCREEKRALRANVDARLVHKGTPEAIRKEGLRVLREAGSGAGFLFGCGVVAYDCDPAHVIALREARDEFSAA